MRRIDLVLIFVIFVWSGVNSTIDPSSPNNPCQDTYAVILPDPNRCYGYVVCIAYRGTFVPCGRNRIFDPILEDCVPGDRNTCEPTASQPTVTSTVTQEPTSPSLETICDDIDYGE
jgi:hypothetical protein